jgi:hypothetical protein
LRDNIGLRETENLEVCKMNNEYESIRRMFYDDIFGE